MKGSPVGLERGPGEAEAAAEVPAPVHGEPEASASRGSFMGPDWGAACGHRRDSKFAEPYFSHSTQRLQLGSSMVAHAYHPSTWETEAGGWKAGANLPDIASPCLKKQTTELH